MNEESTKLKLLAFSSALAMIATIVIVIIFHFNDMQPTMFTGYGTFSDFAETISYNIIKNPYTGEGANIYVRSIYPPIAYLITYPFAIMARSDITDYLQGNIDLYDLYQRPLFDFTYILYFILTMVLIMCVVAKYTKVKGENLKYILISFACLGPFIYTFGRGNIILSTLLFVLLFFYLKDSEIKWKKELSNFFLALAIATKIYPIIFLIYFFKDKKFLDLLKTILITALLIFIPFVVVPGRFDNINVIWNNFHTFDGDEHRNEHNTNISIDSTCKKISNLLDYDEETQEMIYVKSSKILRFSMLGLSIVILPLLKRNKKGTTEFYAITLSILCYILFQGVSYGYTMLFLSIPILYFIINYSSFSFNDSLIYEVLFTAIMFPGFYLIKIFVMQPIALILLLLKVIIDCIRDIFKKDDAIINEEEQIVVK